MAISIVYQDDHLVVVDKPANLLVHRTTISSDRIFLVQTLRDQLGKRVYPVHRLDRPTSGILVLSFHSHVANKLSEQFRNGQVNKTYGAIVRGYVEDDAVIDYPLREGPDEPLLDAVTQYRCLKRVEIKKPVGRYETARYSLVEIEPKTGRFHQIRKHFAHISHPIVGDVTHGHGVHNRFFRESFDCHRLMLRAIKMELEHPVTHQDLSVRVDGDPLWEQIFCD